MRKLFIQKMLLTTMIALSSIPVSVYAAEESDDELKSMLGLYKAGTVNERLKANKSTIQSQQEEINSLKLQKSNLEGTLDSLKNEVREKNRQVGELDGKLVSIERAKGRAEGELERLRAQSSRIETSNNQCREEQGRLQVRIEELETTIGEKTAEIDETEGTLRANKERLAAAEQDIKEAQAQLRKCQQGKGELPLTYTQHTIKATSLIALKDQINQVANLSPYSAPSVLGVSVGNSRQVSEVVGHTLQAVYDKHKELDRFCKDDLREIGTVAAKTIARELALSTLYRVGEKTGLNGKVTNAYQNSRMPGFLEQHATTKAVVESASRLTVGALRLGTDALLETFVWSNLPSGDKSGD